VELSAVSEEVSLDATVEAVSDAAAELAMAASLQQPSTVPAAFGQQSPLRDSAAHPRFAEQLGEAKVCAGAAGASEDSPAASEDSTGASGASAALESDPWLRDRIAVFEAFSAASAAAAVADRPETS